MTVNSCTAQYMYIHNHDKIQYNKQFLGGEKSEKNNKQTQKYIIIYKMTIIQCKSCFYLPSHLNIITDK